MVVSTSSNTTETHRKIQESLVYVCEQQAVSTSTNFLYLSMVAGSGCFIFLCTVVVFCVHGWYKRLLYAQPCPYRTMEMPSGRLQAVWEYSRPRQRILTTCPLVRAPKVKPMVGDDKIARCAQQQWIDHDVYVSANTWNTHASFTHTVRFLLLRHSTPQWVTYHCARL